MIPGGRIRLQVEGRHPACDSEPVMSSLSLRFLVPAPPFLFSPAPGLSGLPCSSGCPSCHPDFSSQFCAFGPWLPDSGPVSWSVKWEITMCLPGVVGSTQLSAWHRVGGGQHPSPSFLPATEKQADFGRGPRGPPSSLLLPLGSDIGPQACMHLGRRGFVVFHFRETVQLEMDMRSHTGSLQKVMEHRPWGWGLGLPFSPSVPWAPAPRGLHVGEGWASHGRTEELSNPTPPRRPQLCPG